MLGGIITNPYLLGECVCSGDVSPVSAVCAAIDVYGRRPTARWSPTALRNFESRGRIDYRKAR
jgi:hypothetical protein